MNNYQLIRLSACQFQSDNYTQLILQIIDSTDNIFVYFDNISQLELQELIYINTAKLSNMLLNLIQIIKDTGDQDYNFLLQQFSCINLLPFQLILYQSQFIDKLISVLPLSIISLSNIIFQLPFTDQHIQDISNRIEIEIVEFLISDKQNTAIIEQYGFLILQAVRNNPQFNEYIQIVESLLPYDQLNIPFTLQLLNTNFTLNLNSLLRSFLKFHNKLVLDAVIFQLVDFKHSPEILNQFVEIFTQNFFSELSPILPLIYAAIDEIEDYNLKNYVINKFALLDEQQLIFSVQIKHFQNYILQFISNLASYNGCLNLFQRLKDHNFVNIFLNLVKQNQSVNLQETFLQLVKIDYFDEMQQELILIYLNQ